MAVKRRKVHHSGAVSNVGKSQLATRSTETSWLPYIPLVVTAVFSCVLTAVVWYQVLRERGVEEYARIIPVPVIHVSPASKFAVDAIARQEPVVIKNTVTSTWRASRLWTPSYLQEKLPSITGVYENNNRWFGPYYDTSKPLTNTSHRINNYTTDLVLSGREFFRRIQNPIEGRFHYYTGNIEQLGDWALSDISPFNELLSPNPKRSSINVWMGQPQVVAHCHYDGYHNFYAQLYGTKKFTMFQPTNWPGLYLYPFLHPSHAQAQVNLSSEQDLSRYPLTRHVTAYQVVLKPGDLLYMPPLWFHYVESLSVSISTNVWTDSEQTTVMEELFDLSLPLGEVDWDGEHLRAIAGSLVLTRAVEQVCRKRKCVSYKNDVFSDSKEVVPDHVHLIQRLWKTRYQQLMEKGEQSSSFASEQTRWRKSLLCENGALPDLFLKSIIQKMKRTSLEAYIVRLGELMVRLPEDTWEIWFGNYLEYIAASSVRLKLVGLFLKHSNSCTKYMIFN